MIFDNTMIEAFKSCPQKYRYRHIKNLIPNEESNIDLVAGQAFARGIETLRNSFYRKNLSIDESMDQAKQAIKDVYLVNGDMVIPKYNYKTLTGMLGAFEAYMEKWVPGKDGYKPLFIEQSLSMPITLWDSYYGTPDCIAEDADGVLWAIDEKTTGRFSDDWYAQWTLNSQMTGYVALMTHQWPNREIGGCIIRGVSINKDGAKCIEVKIRRMQWEIDEWSENTFRVVNLMMFEETNEVSIRMNNYTCVRCSYLPICSSNERGMVIKNGYQERKWEPLNVINKKDDIKYDGR